MEMEKMEKKEIKKIEKIVKRKDYKFLVNFFKKVENLNMEKVNKESIEKNYLEISKNKVFSNIERVFKRSLRKEIRVNLESELKDSNMSIEKYLEIGEKIVNLSKNKNNKLIEVKI
jgi:hypothetical protein